MSTEIVVEVSRVQSVADEVRATKSISKFLDSLKPLFAEDKKEFVSMLDENVGYVTDLLHKQFPGERQELRLEVMNNSLILPLGEFKLLQSVIDGSKDFKDPENVAAFHQQWWNGESYCIYNAKELRGSRGSAYVRHETTHWLLYRLRRDQGEVLPFALADAGVPMSSYGTRDGWLEDYSSAAIWGNMISNIPFPSDDARRRFYMDLIYSKDLRYGKVAALANEQFIREGIEPFL